MIKIKKIIYLSSMILVASSISGCVTNLESSQNSSAESLIAQKVAIAVDAQQKYKAITQQDIRLQNQTTNDFNTEIINVDYIGKPIPLLNALSNRYGFNLIEIGKKTDLQIINVNMKDVAPIDILLNISKQIDYGADLVLDKETKTLKVIYK